VAVSATPTTIQTELPPGTASPTATHTSVPPTTTPTSLGTMTTATATQATTQATLPPPQITGTQPTVLIPVTGLDLSSPMIQLERTQHSLTNLGLALLGIGLIFQGIVKKIEIHYQ
jgi:hypothetical protein